MGGVVLVKTETKASSRSPESARIAKVFRGRWRAARASRACGTRVAWDDRTAKADWSRWSLKAVWGDFKAWSQIAEGDVPGFFLGRAWLFGSASMSESTAELSGRPCEAVGCVAGMSREGDVPGSVRGVDGSLCSLSTPESTAGVGSLSAGSIVAAHGKKRDSICCRLRTSQTYDQ